MEVVESFHGAAENPGQLVLLPLLRSTLLYGETVTHVKKAQYLSESLHANTFFVKSSEFSQVKEGSLFTIS